nr:ankyrin repeat domain containing protein 17 [Hymenolepis microstoma]
MIAASRGFSEILHILLSRGASLNAKDNDGNFAIHLAAEHGHLECVRLLMEKKCLANVGNSRYHTPLMLAAAKGHVHIVNHLLDNGVNMAYKLNKHFESELTLAARFKHLEIVKVLLRRADAGIDRSAELNEAYSNALLSSTNEIVETLLSAGADVNYFEIPNALPLFTAIGRRDVNLVKTLHRHGVDLTKVDEDGYNALMYAVAIEHFEVVEFFISLGFDLNVKSTESNLTAIDIAEFGEDRRIFEILRKAQRESIES